MRFKHKVNVDKEEVGSVDWMDNHGWWLRESSGAWLNGIFPDEFMNHKCASRSLPNVGLTLAIPRFFFG